MSAPADSRLAGTPGAGQSTTMLGWFWKIHRWVVGGEAWAAAYSWLGEHLPKIWGWTKEHGARVAAMVGLSSVGTWFASGIEAVNALGWGAWPFVGLVFALGTALLFYVIIVVIDRLRRLRHSSPTSGMSAESPASPTQDTLPSMLPASSARLPTAAELLDEQENREAFSAMEELIHKANYARKQQLEAVLVIVADRTVNQHWSSSKALQFFVRHTVYSQHRQACKAAVRSAERASLENSLERLSESAVRLMDEYYQGQGYPGILTSNTGVCPTVSPNYKEWETGEADYVVCARRCSELRLIKRVLGPRISSISNAQVFAERDPATMMA